MNIQEVYDLLDKYYRGETTNEEEIILSGFFRNGDVPPELEAEKEIFRFYGLSSEIPLPDNGFEERIISAIDKSEHVRPGTPIRRRLYAVISSAAAILLIITSYLLFIQRDEPTDTFSDPSLAYAETMKILYSVSSKLNNGINALEPVNKMESAASKSMAAVARSTGMIESNLEPLGYFQKAVDIVNSPLGKVNK